MTDGDHTVICFALDGTLVRDGPDGPIVSDAVHSSLSTLADDETITLCVLAEGDHDSRRRQLADLGIAEFVDRLVTEAEAGGPKASGAPYEYVREHVAADEYVMVGDDYAADVEAARAAGFVPIHYEETDGPDLFVTLRAML